MEEPLITKYLQATANKEHIITSFIDDISFVKNDLKKPKSICSLTREIRKSNKCNVI